MELIEQLNGIKTLLIVNDPMFLDEMELAFEESGLHVQAYNSAEFALQAVQLDDYDAIICCNELPGMSGMEFFRQIRLEYPDTIKILCGESSDTALVAESYQARIHDFLLKPFPFKILLATLCMHLRKRRKPVVNLNEDPRWVDGVARNRAAQWQMS